MTNSYADISQADAILLIGSNVTEAHPVIGLEVKKAARKDADIIVVDPRHIRIVDHATSWLRLRPGTNVALINAMMRVIVDEGLEDRAFIEERTEGFDELLAHLKGVDVAEAAKTCGVSEEQIRSAARTYASAERASIIYAMGVTQHSTGTEQVRVLADLAMLTGNIGKPGTGVNPLRGQNNVQGACDLACLPNCLPGYQSLAEEGTLDRVCDFWQTDVDLAPEPGLTIVEMMDAAAAGSLKAMYIMGENPALSDPDQTHVEEALAALDFLVVQDIFLTETTEYADVVLPAASFLEKDGTFTNSERRIQRVRKVVEAPGEALPDLDILIRLANALGLDWEYDGPADVMWAMSAITPQYAGVTYERLDRDGGIQWPCPDKDHPGTPILHVDGFARGKGAFAAVEYTPPQEDVDSERPFILTTGRHLWNFHTNTMTGRSAGLDVLNPTGYVEISTEDAERLGICDGDRVRVSSRQGEVETSARVTDRIAPGVVFMPFHFADSPANALTSAEDLDPLSKIPELKVTPVSVERV